MWSVWENIQPQRQPVETPAALHWSQTTTTTATTRTATTYNCVTTTNVRHQSSSHVNGRCCETSQYRYAGDTAPRPPINRPPPPTSNEDIPRQTPRLQVSGWHHDCVSQGGGPECCHKTASYSNLGNDCCICSRCRTNTPRLQPAATKLHRGIRIERIRVGILPFPRPPVDIMAAYIPLPLWIQTRRAVVNVVGADDDCFKWAMLAGMHPVDDVHADRRGKYFEHMGKYDFSSLSFPVPLQSVGPFALRNNMSINVYGGTMTTR